MEPEKKLKQEFFVIFSIIGTIAIAMVAAIIVFTVNKNSILISADKFINNLFFYGLIVLFSVGIFILSYEIIKYGKDFKAAKNGQFEKVTGTVLRFAKNQDTESGRQINCIPIIQIDGSNDTIKLSVNSFTKIGETYTFIYLKHTKMGAVKTLE